MKTTNEPLFAIPTYRLRDVGEAIEAYDRNFTRNGHSINLFIFDDSSIANHQRYYQLLEQTKTKGPIHYVGPAEKEEFTKMLLKRLGNPKLEPLVNSLFRPSYGGNRNFALMYTIGDYLISADDDMRPEGLIANGSIGLDEQEAARGRVVPNGIANGHRISQYDVLGAFLEVIGKEVKHAPTYFAKADHLEDTAMDLETNTTKSFQEHNSLLIREGRVPPSAVIRMAQTYRTGTNDIDALDYATFFLDHEEQLDPQELNHQYVLENFRPVITSKNWRMDCGVAAYDNTIGLPPFFPTRLRFEDYIYRLWAQQESVASAHVDAVQRHLKNNYMREPLSSDLLNEELANLLKKKIKGTLTRTGDLGINFSYDGSVNFEDTDEILERITAVHKRALEKASSTGNPERERALRKFANNLERTFYGFEHDFFQQNVSRIVDDEIGLIKSSMELWPTLVEIVYYQRHKQTLPETLVKNKRS